MNNTQLECFVKVAQCLNFRRAAEDLRISQPSVTKQVASLEKELGGPLFVRSTRTVALTDLGETFLPDAREILQLMSDASEKATRVTDGGGLIIGYNDTGQLYTISKVLEKFRESHPNVSVLLHQGTRDTIEERLEKGMLDVAFGYYAEALITGGTVFTCLKEDVLFFITSKDSKYATYSEVRASDLIGERQIICMPASLRRRSPRMRKPIPEAMNSETMYCETTTEAQTLAEAGYGFTLIPTSSCVQSPNRAIIKWDGDYRAKYGIYSNNNHENEIVDDFIRLAEQVFKETV